MKGNRPREELTGEQIYDKLTAEAALGKEAGDVDVVGGPKSGVLFQVRHHRRGDRVAANAGRQ